MTGLVARCGPLSLLAGSALLMIGGLAAPRLTSLAAASAVLGGFLLIVTARTGFPLLRLLPGVLAVTSVGWSNWLLGDPRTLESAVHAGLRMGFFVIPGIVFASYLSPVALGDHLGQRLRLPARPVVATVAALQQAERLGADWEELARTRRIRGLGPGRGPVQRLRHLGAVALGLLVEALRAAAVTSTAMEARGYSLPRADRARRTWAEPAPWTTADTVLMTCCVVIAAVALVPW